MRSGGGAEEGAAGDAAQRGQQLTDTTRCVGVWQGVAGAGGGLGTQHESGEQDVPSPSERRSTLHCNVAGVSQDALGSTQTRGEPGGSHLPGGRVSYPG